MTEPRQRRWIETCTFCPNLCLYTCPVSNGEGRDSVSPWAKMSLVGWMDRGALPLDEETAVFAYKCLGCLACHTPCRHDVEVPEVLFRARAEAVRAGVGPFKAEQFVMEKRLTRDGETLLQRLESASPKERFVDEAQALLVPGVDTLIDLPELVGDVFRLADLLAIDYLAVGEASALDIGYSLWAAGYHDRFLAQARAFLRLAGGYRKLVVLSPHDLYMLTVVYPRFELGPLPTIEPALTLLTPMLGARVAGEPVPGRVRFHDPCYLGRHLGMYDEPRRALAYACSAPPGELRWRRAESYCCGGGGGLDETSPDTAAHAAGTVTDNAQALGTGLLVTACATCVKMFRTAAPGLPVEHLLTVLARAFTAPVK